MSLSIYNFGFKIDEFGRGGILILCSTKDVIVMEKETHHPYFGSFFGNASQMDCGSTEQHFPNLGMRVRNACRLSHTAGQGTVCVWAGLHQEGARNASVCRQGA